MDEGINQCLNVEHGGKNLEECFVEIEVLVLKFLHTLYSSCFLVLKLKKRPFCVSFLLVLKLQIIAFLIEALPYF